MNPRVPSLYAFMNRMGHLTSMSSTSGHHSNAMKFCSIPNTNGFDEIPSDISLEKPRWLLPRQVIRMLLKTLVR